MEKKIERSCELDLLRVIACIGVVSIHFSMFYDTSWILIVRTFVAMSVPLFMSISGYLLFYSKDYSYKEIIINHFLRYLILFELWKWIYLIVAWNFSENNDILSFIKYAIQNGEGWHLWYLRVHLGMILCYPIIRAITKERNLVSFFSVLWILFFSLRYSLATWMRIPNEIIRLFNLPFFQYSYLISGTIKGFYPMEPVGLYVAGGAFINYLEEQKRNVGNNLNALCMRLIIVALITYFTTVIMGYSYKYDNNYFFAYYCDPYMINVVVIMVGVMAFAYIFLYRVRSNWFKDVLEWVADKTLGIYVAQSIIYRWILKLLNYFNIDNMWIKRPLIFFGVIIGGVLMSVLIKSILPRKFSKYIV